MILLESVPTGVDMGDVKHDLEKVLPPSCPRIYFVPNNH
jgi:hypothetical protein